MVNPSVKAIAFAAILNAQPGAAATATGEEGPLAVPSGQPVSFVEMIWDQPGGGLVYRFRFLAPQIGQKVGFDSAAADMEFLCREYALPRLAEIGPQPRQIIISLSDRAVDFGVLDSDAVQFFEAYRVENGGCIWEVY